MQLHSQAYHCGHLGGCASIRLDQAVDPQAFQMKCGTAVDHWVRANKDADTVLGLLAYILRPSNAQDHN